MTEPKEVACYNYTDSFGNILYSKIRIEPGPNGKKKTFRVEGLTDDIQRVLYNMVGVANHQTIFIVEGEKDAETIGKLGYTATTIFDGASGKWLPEYSTVLKGKDVLIIPDNDEPGRKYAAKVSEGLAGYAKSIRIIKLPVPEKGDVTDYFEGGGTHEEFASFVNFAVELKQEKKARIENKQLREPAATQSEKLVLGAVLNGTSTFEDIEELQMTDFYHDEHRIIFSAIKTLWSEMGVGDVKAIAQYLDDKRLIEQVGGITALLDLTEDMPSVYSIEAHIEAIRNKAGSRILLEHLENAANMLVLGENCEKVQAHVTENAGKMIVSNRNLVTTAAGDLIVNLDDLLKPKPQGITCDPVQPVFDAFFGLQPGVLLTIGARSGHGKTSLMNQIIAYGCVKYKNPTDLLTFEIPKDDALVKIICQTAKVPYLDVLRGNVTDEQRDKIKHIASMFKNAPFRIDDKNSWSIPKLRSYLKTRKSSGDPLRMLCIDYLQIMNMTGGSQNDRRDLAIGKVTSGLKGLAIEFGISIVLLSQLNRAMDRDGSDTPGIGNLRDSSGQENDSDIVILISQKMDEVSEDGEFRPSKIIIAKNRNGAVGSFNAAFHMNTASFICN